MDTTYKYLYGLAGITLLVLVLLLPQFAGGLFPVAGTEPQTIHEKLAGKTQKEKINIKGDEIAKKNLKGQYTDFAMGITVEITSEVKKIEDGIELYAKAWKDGKPLGFGADGTIEIERFQFINPPVLVDDPNGTIETYRTDNITGERKTRKLKEDPVRAIQESLAHSIKVTAKDGANIVKGKIGNTVTSFYPAAGDNSPTDDFTRQTYTTGAGQSWATIIGAAGSDAWNNSDNGLEVLMIRSDTTDNNWRQLSHAITLFNTATIGTDTISGATYSLASVADKLDQGGIAPDLNIYSASPADATNQDIVAGDYDSIGTTQFATTITYANLNNTDGQYLDWTFNATGIAAIAKTGVSKFGPRNANYDVSGTPPAWASNKTSRWDAYSADADGTSKDPKLTVTHASAAPPEIPRSGDVILFE